MCKQIKRLILLSECPHLNKTDRDAITFILRETGNIKVEPDKGFGGFDFSLWPIIPSQNIFNDWIKTRKSTGKSIITQTFIDSCVSHLDILNKLNISTDHAISFAAKGGWQGFKSKWVIDEIEREKSNIEESKIISPDSEKNYIALIMLGRITHISQIKGYKNIMSSNYKQGLYDDVTNKELARIGFTGLDVMKNKLDDKSWADNLGDVV